MKEESAPHCSNGSQLNYYLFLPLGIQTLLYIGITTVTFATNFITLGLDQRSTATWFYLIVSLMPMPAVSTLYPLGGVSIPNSLISRQYTGMHGQLSLINKQLDFGGKVSLECVANEEECYNMTGNALLPGTQA